jgi:hypothetical protein
MYQAPFKAAVCLLGLAALLATLPAAAAGGCVRFDGIDHCPVGNAQLSLAQDGSQLMVTGLGAGGKDGVRSIFSGAAYWQADLSAPPEGFGDGFTFSAISNGFRTARTSLHLDNALGLVYTNEFTGGNGGNPYTVQVISNGFLVAEFQNLDSSTTFSVRPNPGPGIPWPPWPGWPELPDDDWPPIIIFGLGSVGECFWGHLYSNDMQVSISNGLGQAVGDEVRVIENVGPGQYPYTSFDGMVIQSNTSGFAIDSEAVSP